MTIEIKGADELRTKTERIATRLEQPAGAEPELTAIFQSRLASRFAAGGEGDWAPLSDATTERWGEHPPLRLTGALQAAMTSGQATATADAITYDPNAPFYGAIVDASRPVMPPGDPQLADEVTRALDAYVMGGG
jgi:hypothetical protein